MGRCRSQKLASVTIAARQCTHVAPVAIAHGMSSAHVTNMQSLQWARQRGVTDAIEHIGTTMPACTGSSTACQDAHLANARPLVLPVPLAASTCMQCVASQQTCCILVCGINKRSKTRCAGAGWTHHAKQQACRNSSCMRLLRTGKESAQGHVLHARGVPYSEPAPIPHLPAQGHL